MTATATATEAIYNGTYTLTNATGEHKTFKVKTQKDDASFAPGKRIVQLMTGSDNEQSFTGFGFVDGEKINTWKSKKGNGKPSAFEYFAWLLPRAAAALIDFEGETVDASFVAGGREYRVQLSKRCLRCNRKLTTPESIDRGYGAECAAALGML